MVTLADYRNERLKKLDRLREKGIDPYPAQTSRTHKIAEIVNNPVKFTPALEDESVTEVSKTEKPKMKTVTLVGRVMVVRSFGRIAFVKIRDDSGEIQIFMQRAEGEKVDNPNHRLDLRSNTVKLLDVGDFVEATGVVDRTSSGELSLFANEVKLLTKTLRPLPGRDGLTNKEERYRRRYVDMNVNPEVRERLKRRSIFWQATRDYMNAHGFIEVNTPILETTTGGADAKPFVTHMDALDQDYYLRISQELPLKRLLGGGFERVYDIGPRFRNEGVDDEHLPEHIAFEAYAAYEDYESGMDFYENMFRYVAQKTWGTLKFKINDFEIDLEPTWPRVKYADLIDDHFKIDAFNPDINRLLTILQNHRVPVDKIITPDSGLIGDDSSRVMTTPRALDALWKLLRKNSAGPFWLIDEPLSLSPLAKKSPENPLVTQRVHPVIAGTELGNGYSELNDPLDQLKRFEEQQAMRDFGDDEAQMLDRDFVEMLEYGMPPAFGWGNSERVFWVFEGVSGREAVPFPIIKPKD